MGLASKMLKSREGSRSTRNCRFHPKGSVFPPVGLQSIVFGPFWGVTSLMDKYQNRGKGLDRQEIVGFTPKGPYSHPLGSKALVWVLFRVSQVWWKMSKSRKGSRSTRNCRFHPKGSVFPPVWLQSIVFGSFWGVTSLVEKM